MAQRLRPVRLPTFTPAARASRLAASAQQRWTTVQADWRRDPVAFLWLAFWSPFWIASDAPKPALPGTTRREIVTPPTAAGEMIAGRLDTVTRRFWRSWIAGSIFRGVTVALLALSAWALVGVIWSIDLPSRWAVIAVLVAGVVLGAIHGWFLRPDQLMVARMLDHTFGLDERIVTALDREVDTSYVSRLQLADAANTLYDVLTDVPRTTFVPVREAALCLVALGALVTALLANVPQEPIDPMGNSPVPGFVPASDRLAVQERAVPQSSQQQEPRSEESLAQIQDDSRQAQTAREDLATIGEALESNPLTQPAAESISSGDYTGAADQLREAAPSVGNMPQGQRDSLADSLETAADQLEETNPELAQAARDAADALREGGPGAEQALNDLADQIDQSAEQAQQSGGSSPNLDESQPGGSEGESGGEGQEGEQPGSGEQGQSGEQEQQGGQSSDPGAGSDAAPGVKNSDQPTDSSNSQGEGGAEGAASEQGGDAPQPGEASQGGNSGDDSGATGGESGDQAGQQGAPDEETNASQGSGAGTGQEGANDQSEGGQGPANPSSSEPDPNAEVPQEGEAGEPPPSREDRGEEDDGSGSNRSGGASLQLEGTSDENIPAGNNSGTSSLGSGSGSSTSSGDQGQGTIGVAGPDSNRVPEDARDVVQDYFTGPQP